MVARGWGFGGKGKGEGVSERRAGNSEQREGGHRATIGPDAFGCALRAVYFARKKKEADNFACPSATSEVLLNAAVAAALPTYPSSSLTMVLVSKSNMKVSPLIVMVAN